MPDPMQPEDGSDPEHEALLADSVGLALLVVLETLAPAERLAFVLHDMFAVPFDEIAPIVERSPTAARQLASRARPRAWGGWGAGRRGHGFRHRSHPAARSRRRLPCRRARRRLRRPARGARPRGRAAKRPCCPALRAQRRKFAARRPWPAGRWWAAPGPRNQRSSMEPWESWLLHVDGC